jgi:hypothetical protein
MPWGPVSPDRFDCATVAVPFFLIRCVTPKPKEIDMANRQQKGNREAKKPKKEKIKASAAAPSQKAAAWQPTLASDKKK